MDGGCPRVNALNAAESRHFEKVKMVNCKMLNVFYYSFFKRYARKSWIAILKRGRCLKK